jgi:hypothetical protein
MRSRDRKCGCGGDEREGQSVMESLLILKPYVSFRVKIWLCQNSRNWRLVVKIGGWKRKVTLSGFGPDFKGGKVRYFPVH